MKEGKRVEEAYRLAREAYAEVGVDSERALERLQAVSLSVHCWQGDDVGGFETAGQGTLGGGIAATGSYPGKARTLEELRQDLERLYALLPGRHRLALHMSYGDFGGRRVDRDRIRPEHFASWLDWGRERGVALDMNSTFFSHPKAAGGLTLASKDPAIRAFWVEHARRTREVGVHLGRGQGSPCIHNLWIPDGMKDYPVDRLGYRRMLARSLDEIFAEPYPTRELKDALEGKLFGLGSEAFVVGSHEFYLLYAARHGQLITLDSGHFHPTESVADKISSVLLFCEELLLHISRGMRWDSDHVVLLDDGTRALLDEVVRCGKLEQVHLGLDFFDASINRLGAWTVGGRAVLKALLAALLEPQQELARLETAGDYFARMQTLELLKTLPLGAVWDYHCLRAGAPLESEVLSIIRDYDQAVARKRG
jgi:L-rhamnose isomerase